MSWAQKEFKLSAKKRGCHLVTQEVLKNIPEIKDFKIGLANIFSMFNTFFRMVLYVLLLNS